MLCCTKVVVEEEHENFCRLGEGSADAEVTIIFQASLWRALVGKLLLLARS